MMWVTVTEMKSAGGGAVTVGAERRMEEEGGEELTFHGDFPAACQVCLVAHKDDGHVVCLMCAPQLNAEL